MKKLSEANSLRRKFAIEKLRTIGVNPSPDEIRAAVLACFDAGAPSAARRVLKRYGKRADVENQPWNQRFLFWIDATDAKRRLADKSPILLDEVEKISALASRLRKASRFNLSRRLLAKLLDEPEDLLAARVSDSDSQKIVNVLFLEHEERRKLMQQLALSTYKDADLHPSRALPEAERLLMEIGLDDPACKDPETLGLGGAVCKRRWELTGQREHLVRSFVYYRRGWKARDSEKNRYDKDGYCGINAAFIWDLLASRDVFPKRISPQSYSTRLRQVIISEIGQRLTTSEREISLEDRWAVTSLADAYFGVGDYENAGRYYETANQLMAGDWERKTTFLQALALAQLQGISLPEVSENINEWHPAWRALWPLFGDRTAAALAGARPKTGLALSGGGFRAAFYHLGMLARLAEADALRHVEVISTVSGGSIVGTLYFLKLKKLLENKRDEEITSADYCQLVRELIDEFRAGVEQNLRMRAFASITAIGRMAYKLAYNRTWRIGELYDKYFYRKALGNKQQPVLRDLIVVPKGESGEFSPRQDNMLRYAKVPILLINATNLNSGHSWQFAGRFMGEPPGLLEAEIDANERYARIHFDERKGSAMQDFSLGAAVAASSAVPGIFNPMRLPAWYENRDVQLSDGGVYDNQGIDTLLQEDCKIILCSDGSGQLDDAHSPSTLLFGVLRRANDISMERIRIVSYQDMRARLESGALKGLLFVHLRQGLDIRRVEPQAEKRQTSSTSDAATQTNYGVDSEIQRKLSRIRTDLDSFTEVETDALMLSGYLATNKQIEQDDNAIAKKQNYCDWQFGSVDSYLRATTNPADSGITARITDIKRQLAVSGKTFAKPLFLVGCPLKIVPFAGIGLIALAVVILGCIAYWKAGLSVLAIPGGVAALAVLSFVALVTGAGKSQTLPALRRLGELLLAVLILPIAHVGLWPGNSLFLRRGSMDYLKSIK